MVPLRTEMLSEGNRQRDSLSSLLSHVPSMSTTRWLTSTCVHYLLVYVCVPPLPSLQLHIHHLHFMSMPTCHQVCLDLWEMLSFQLHTFQTPWLWVIFSSQHHFHTGGFCRGWFLLLWHKSDKLDIYNTVKTLMSTCAGLMFAVPTPFGLWGISFNKWSIVCERKRNQPNIS